jgi:D-sedoheptulose 7-phosphate isomerase
MKTWISYYIEAQKQTLASIPIDKVGQLIAELKTALNEERQIFVIGNGGSAANASHFSTDLGKGASDKLGRRFRVMSLNDNVSWMTALGNDYSYKDIFVRQLENFARADDLLIVLSVSGRSPNILQTVEWARNKRLKTVAFVGQRGRDLAERVDIGIVLNSEHYGRVEDAEMGICHILCYYFMENSETLNQ